MITEPDARAQGGSSQVSRAGARPACSAARPPRCHPSPGAGRSVRLPQGTVPATSRPFSDRDARPDASYVALAARALAPRPAASGPTARLFLAPRAAGPRRHGVPERHLRSASSATPRSNRPAATPAEAGPPTRIRERKVIRGKDLRAGPLRAAPPPRRSRSRRAAQRAACADGSRCSRPRAPSFLGARTRVRAPASLHGARDAESAVVVVGGLQRYGLARPQTHARQRREYVAVGLR